MCVLVPLHYIRPLIYRKGIEGWCGEENMDVLTHWRRHMSYIHSTFPACNRNLTIHRKLKCALDLYNHVCSRICKMVTAALTIIIYLFICSLIWYFLVPSNKDNFSFFEIFQHNLMKVSMLPKIGISRIIESGILLKCNQQSTMTPIIRAGGSTGKMSNIFNWSWYFPLFNNLSNKETF